jgi:hypothetical protein
MDHGNLILEPFAVVIINAEVSRDKVSKGIESSNYGHGMTGRMFD